MCQSNFFPFFFPHPSLNSILLIFSLKSTRGNSTPPASNIPANGARDFGS